MILLKSIHDTIKEMPSVEKADEELTRPLVVRLDRVTFACSCEGYFNDELSEIYKAFRLRFGFEFAPRKLSL